MKCARHWLDCPSSLTHGNMIQRVIFTREDPENPGVEGAVMRNIESFARAYLEPGVSSVPHVNEGIQETFFVVDGEGILLTDDGERPIRGGNGIYVPPDVRHTFINSGNKPLEFVIVVEVVPNGAEVEAKTALISNYRENPMGIGHWKFLDRAVFAGTPNELIHDRKNRMVQRHAILVVVMDPMQTSDSHPHTTDKDEIWYMLKGEGVHVVGEEMVIHKPGMAIQVAPCSPGHTLINHTCEPLMAFYIAAAVYRVEDDGSYARVLEPLPGSRTAKL
ncbi:MAG: cupin domain-containing protein [Candidatus Poribacteria bacterium]|nr:cupin domain-containing protein [Candidatus Poribacteria bacterium]MDE0505428.1 cupin domain-containing protein [Candidatus Poribacteria bacterium]